MSSIACEIWDSTVEPVSNNYEERVILETGPGTLRFAGRGEFGTVDLNHVRQPQALTDFLIDNEAEILRRVSGAMGNHRSSGRVFID